MAAFIAGHHTAQLGKHAIPIPRGGFTSNEEEARWLEQTLRLRIGETLHAAGINATIAPIGLHELLMLSLDAATRRANLARVRAPAASDAIEAATMAVYDHRMPDGDALGVLLHESHYIDDSPPIAEQLAAVRDLCKEIARAATAAYHAALPRSDYRVIKEALADTPGDYLPGTVQEIARAALAAITALEARLTDARAQERERICQLLSDNADKAEKRKPEEVTAYILRANITAIRALAAHEAAEKMANG